MSLIEERKKNPYELNIRKKETWKKALFQLEFQKQCKRSEVKGMRDEARK